MNLYNVGLQKLNLINENTNEKCPYYDLENQEGLSLGTCFCEYNIKAIENVSNLESEKNYLLTIMHKITINPLNSYEYGPQDINTFNNYPVAIDHSLKIKPIYTLEEETFNATILNISPKTINSSINSSLNYSGDAATGTNYSSGAQQGSSKSNTNNFNISIGSPTMAGASDDKTEEKGKSTDFNSTLGGNSNSSTSVSNTANTSIKDWSAYGKIDISNTNPSWTFAQSYPYDPLEYNYTKEDINNIASKRAIDLPLSIQGQMIVGDQVLPPSHLSLFGPELVAKVTWLISFPKNFKKEEVGIHFTTSCYTASHFIEGGNIKLLLDQKEIIGTKSYTSPKLNLTQYSLIPISDNFSGINLQKGKCDFYPDNNSNKDIPDFRIISRENDFLVEGYFFNKNLTPKIDALTFRDHNNQRIYDVGMIPYIEIYFKISSLLKEYSLYFIHWKTASSNNIATTDFKLAININDDEENTYYIYVNDLEGKGSTNNTSIFYLRNLDYLSEDFHDFLKLGLNKIKIYIIPITNNKEKITNNYRLFSLGIN